MNVGRPTKYDDKFCSLICKVVGEQGKSVTQFARDIKVSKSTIYKWAQEFSEFSDALDIAQDWSQAHWEDKLEEMMYSKDVNTPLVKLYFANRFKWHDRPEGEKEAAQPITISIVNPNE